MTHINVMAPLVVGDPADPNSEKSRRSRDEFKAHLKVMKAKGVHAVSTDVWWGLVEPTMGHFEFGIYDWVAAEIKAVGLKWVPIISMHRCGGNVGDTVNIPVPMWLWAELAAKIPNGTARDVQCVSEQGNASDEFFSPWAVDLALPYVRALFAAFQKHFANYADTIAEINISLGPAGELRFPSYNNHDKGTGYPTRGALQCYSRLAREALTNWCLKKYGSHDGVRNAWGSLENIEPPVDVDAFFANRVHLLSRYGMDLFDFNQDSLFEHGRKILTAALEEFAADGAPFKGKDVGAKFPGVHWRTGTWVKDEMVMGDRLAELTCGLIRTSLSDWYDEEKGHGYRPIIGLFKELQAKGNGSRVVLHFTCLEMADDADPKANTLAFQLVRWVGNEALRQGVPIKGENALAGTLGMRESWHRMRMAIGMPGRVGLYEGLTILRMGDCVTNQTASYELENTIRLANGDSSGSEAQAA